jgi:ferric-dicitrate binding protein FerR (iron transport regulator)
MKPIRCIKSGFLIEKRAAGLSQPERLRLEEHLAGCDSCNRDAQTLTALRDLISTVQSPITPAERNRAIRTALNLPNGLPKRPAVKPIIAAFACAGVLAASAASWILFLQPSDAAKPVAAVQPNRVEVPFDRVLSGEVIAGNQTVRAGAALKQNAFYESETSARLALGHAKVELRANTRIKWRKSDSTVELVAGSILTDVDPSADDRFRVTTDRFIVEVLGTRFEVDRKGVKVHRGAVRIRARDGKVLVASLSAPESWQIQPLIAVERETTVSPLPEVIPKRVSQKASCKALLKRARSLLANDKPEEATAMIRIALARSPTRSDRAEAKSLQAECALIQGDLLTAAADYRIVANRYKGLPAAENALFAATRIEKTRGDKAEAIALLERYLREYPNGRFRKEVVRRLKALGQL